MLKVGIIGFGGRMQSVLGELLQTGQVTLCAVADPDVEGARARAAACNQNDCVFYTDAKEMLDNEQLDGVCIGTRCSSHTDFALLAASYNLPIFLEKPVCTNYEDLERLKTILSMDDKIVVSFPLRMTDLVLYVKEIIDSGKLGTIEHVQAYNNVPYARGYYHKWYQDEEETGGLFLQKATHDLDYINFLLGERRPVRVCAMKSKQIFFGDKPAGFRCADCDEAATCPESPQNVKKLGDGLVIGELCCFSKSTGNEDSGSAIVEYDTGMHAVYSQDFIVRAAAGKRGARLIGYRGTVEFDFYTGVVTVYQHLRNITETHTFNASGSAHFGGDRRLAENFVGVMQGTERSNAPLSEGIRSAALCLGAKKSSTEHVFVEL